MNIGNAILSGQNPYTLPSNALLYPPLWGIFCAISSYLYSATRNIFVQYFAIKVPIIIADIAISLIVRQIVYNLTNSEKKAKTALIFYLFNPVTIIVSSLWGMFDAIPTLLAIISLMFLYQNKYLKSSLTLGFGIAFKGFFPGLLLPFFVFYIWKKNHQVLKSIQYVFYTLLIPLVFSMPFLITDFNSYISSMLFHINRIPQNMTYWFVLSRFLDSMNIPTVLVTTVSSFFSIAAFLIIYILVFTRKTNNILDKKNNQGIKFGVCGYLLVIFVFYVTVNTVNEQYFIWVLPALIVFMVSFEKQFKSIFYILSAIVTSFIMINVGPNFFSPIIGELDIWNKLQYSPILMGLLFLIGFLFSIISTIGLITLVKKCQI